MHKDINVKIDNSTVIRVLYIILLGLLFFSVLGKITQPLILIVISFFLAIALNPAVSWIAKKLPSGSRSAATGVAYVAVVAFLVGFFALIFPPIVRQTVSFVKDVPETVQNFKNNNETAKKLVERYKIDKQVDNLTSDLKTKLSKTGGPALSAAGKIGSTIGSIVIVFVLTFMMLVEGPNWFKHYFKLVNPAKRSHQKMLAKRMYKVIVGYVNGQVLIAALGGFFATITLFIASHFMHVNINAIALGGLVALFALLPMVGTTIGAILVVLSSLIVSVPLAIVMAIFFVIYQQLENITIQPYIQSRTNTLTPLLVIISALLGVAIGGILGALLAIPAAGCIKVLADDYYERRVSSRPETT